MGAPTSLELLAVFITRPTQGGFQMASAATQLFLVLALVFNWEPLLTRDGGGWSAGWFSVFNEHDHVPFHYPENDIRFVAPLTKNRQNTLIMW